MNEPKQQPLKIMIVDDCSIDSRMLTNILQSSNLDIHSIKTCHSFRSFSNQIETLDMDLYFLDHSLQDGNGIDLIEQLLEKQPEAVAIMITGNESDNLACKALRLGAQDYIYKSDLSTKTVEQSVKHSLERHRHVHRLSTNQSKLNISKQELEKISKAKSEFLSYFSHEVRTPLSLISGTSELLADTSLSESQKKYVLSFQRASDHLMELVNDALDISKIETGDYKVNNGYFLLSDLIAEITELVEPACHQKKLTFQTALSSHKNIVLNSDKRALRQVLLNLINNAIKFTDQGSIVLKANQKVEDSNPDHPIQSVTFEVIDTGPGFAEDEINTVFDRFAMPEAKNYGKAKSSGLGLNLSKEIIAKLGGEIWLETKPGRGSSFCFNIDSKEK